MRKVPDQIILDDFERLLEIGEKPDDGQYSKIDQLNLIRSLLKFVDEHGRRLLALARTAHEVFQGDIDDKGR